MAASVASLTEATCFEEDRRRPPRTGAHPQAIPRFTIRLSAVRRAAAEFKSAFPDTAIFYALKANSHPDVLRMLANLGVGFEAASRGEIAMLHDVGIHPGTAIFGTAVKARADVRAAYALGIDRFAADAREELEMLAEEAPGTRVFIRAKVDDSSSVFQMSGKFGAQPESGAALLLYARQLGLQPWGLSFSIGSQAGARDAWARGVDSLAPILTALLAEGLRVDTVNIGGGFPVAYDGQPDLCLYGVGRLTRTAAARLPYPVQLVAEPGRRLVATAMSLTAQVLRRIERPDGPWLFLDCGVYNALFEALSYQGRTRYPVRAEGQHDRHQVSFVLAGPTGDGPDIVARDVLLPADLAEGDHLIFEKVGAYTTALASTFNGIPVPPVYVED